MTNHIQQSLPGFIRLRNGKLRARPGMGKTPWGLKPDRMPKPDEDLDLKQGVQNLFQYLLVHLNSQCDLARGGRKDEARQAAFTYQFSGIHAIFKHSKFGLTTEQIFELERASSRVIWSAHPNEVSDYSTDLHAIRFTLARILEQVGPRPARQKFFRFNTRTTKRLNN